MQFLFLDEIPPDLIVFNPMGIVITYLQSDRAVVTGGVMIEHLREREKALEPLGWTGREAEWIALVCLHSGVFIRSQFCRYFNAHRADRRQGEWCRGLKEQRALVESRPSEVQRGREDLPYIRQGDLPGAGGREHPAPEKVPARLLVMRRLLSLDYVLEHPGLNWLPTEDEKVDFFTGMGLPSRLIPRRIYYGAVGAQKRYFALKLPVAGGADSDCLCLRRSGSCDRQ